MDGDLWSGERWGPTWLFTSVCSAHQHQTLASLNMLWCLTFLFNMIILWEEQLVWCGEYKTSQECETALASQYQTLFLVFVFSKFCLFIFSPFCQMFEGSWLSKVSHCVQVLKCHSLSHSVTKNLGPAVFCTHVATLFLFLALSLLWWAEKDLGPGSVCCAHAGLTGSKWAGPETAKY